MTDEGDPINDRLVTTTCPKHGAVFCPPEEFFAALEDRRAALYFRSRRPLG
jgi:hypothetical protein